MSDFKNNKSYWQFYSSSINIKSDKIKNNNITLLIKNELITDEFLVAESFNEHFTSLKSSSKLSTEECKIKIKENFTSLNSEVNDEFDFSFTEKATVHNLLMKLDDSSSPGISGIPVKILKNIDHLTTPITKIINQCIKTKTIPDEWKSAYVTPIYKEKGEKTELNNYRGISVFPPIAKVFEKIIATQIINYINENRLLTDDQHGFRTSYSCETALHELLTDLNIARDIKLVTLVVY